MMIKVLPLSAAPVPGLTHKHKHREVFHILSVLFTRTFKAAPPPSGQLLLVPFSEIQRARSDTTKFPSLHCSSMDVLSSAPDFQQKKKGGTKYEECTG